MMSKEAMKLALVALDIVKIHFTQNRHVNEAITALREALEEQPAQQEKTEARIYVTGHIDWSDANVRESIINMWQAMNTAEKPSCGRGTHEDLN